MRQATIGVIGGTGLGDAIVTDAGGTPVDMETPFGPPSCAPIMATYHGVDVAFLLRHGDGHRHNPTTVPYRANIWAMKKLGVEAIIASGATGSLREEIEPGHLVLCDQVIDKTFKRDSTFFDDGVVAHVELSEPFCPRLRDVLGQAGKNTGHTVHPRGTYVCMEGPQFSTRAESLMHRAWGGDLIGMTCMPEAKLAREAEISYAMVALPTDYDAWRPHDSDVAPESLLKEILGNLQRATESGVALIQEALKLIGQMERPWVGPESLKLALWTDRSKIDPGVKQRLAPILGKYVGEGSVGDA